MGGEESGGKKRDTGWGDGSKQGRLARTRLKIWKGEGWGGRAGEGGLGRELHHKVELAAVRHIMAAWGQY